MCAFGKGDTPMKAFSESVAIICCKIKELHQITFYASNVILIYVNNSMLPYNKNCLHIHRTRTIP